MGDAPISQIRPMAIEDAAAMLAIYAPFVRDTAVSFEDTVPSLMEFTARVGKWLATWAGVVALRDGNLVGYAYASAHRERAAYRWSVETTVYVAAGCHRAGVGRALYQSLWPALQARGFHNAYAGVTLPNAASEGLHRAMGFQPVGVFRRVGHKLGQWHDVAWFHRALGAEFLATTSSDMAAMPSAAGPDADHTDALAVELDHVALAVSDPQRTAAVLAGVFGGQVHQPSAERSAAAELAVQLGPLRLVLVRAEALPAAPHAAHVAIRVPAGKLRDIGDALRRAGWRVEAPQHGPAGRALYFLDADQNLFEVCAAG